MVNNKSFKQPKPPENISTEWQEQQKNICPFGWQEHHYTVHAYKDGVRVEAHDENGEAKTVQVYLFDKANRQSIALFQQAIQPCGLQPSSEHYLSQWNELYPQFKQKILSDFAAHFTTDLNAFVQETKQQRQQVNTDHESCLGEYTTITNSLSKKPHIRSNIKSCQNFLAKSQEFWFAEENKQQIPHIEKQLLKLQRVLAAKNHDAGSRELSNWSNRYLYSPLIRFTGDIPNSAIQKVISANSKKINACYWQEQRKRTSIVGKVAVKFAILNDGSVGTTRIRRSSLRNKNVETCLLKTFQAFAFPKSQNGETTVVEYSFIFVPKD